MRSLRVREWCRVMSAAWKQGLLVLGFLSALAGADCVWAASSGAGVPGGPQEGYRPLSGPVLSAASGEDETERPRRRRLDVEPVVPEGIADPLEPLNRVFFQFNDKLYFWVLKPTARGYEKVVPWEIRTCVRNFFRNLLMPVRAVNCLLQGKIGGFGNEILRFVINTTAGVGGLGDPATAINIGAHDEDLGQTLGVAGVGHGIFLMWPILGPSSVRDTVGMIGDGFLMPVNYYPDQYKYRVETRGLDTVNSTSFRIGDYEALKDASFDPYAAVRDAYFQLREKKLKE